MAKIRLTPELSWGASPLSPPYAASDQRPAEPEGHGVPRMGVLGPAVHEHDFGIARPPDQHRELQPRRQVDELAAHGRRIIEGDVVLGCVLVEQPELVVVAHDGSVDRPPRSAHRTITRGSPRHPWP